MSDISASVVAQEVTVCTVGPNQERFAMMALPGYNLVAGIRVLSCYRRRTVGRGREPSRRSSVPHIRALTCTYISTRGRL